MTKLRNVTARELKEMEADLPILPRTKEVAICATFGGFGISPEAEQLFFQVTGRKYDMDVPRHDPGLIHVIRTLREKACTPYCALALVSVKDKYIIREYDGYETVVEPDDIVWINVED